MAKNSQFVGGMPIPDVDAAQLEEMLQHIVGKAAEAGIPSLGMLAQLQQNRAARMNGVVKALRAELGKDHPRVMAAEAAASSVSEFANQAGTRMKRADKFPVPGPNEWVVFGTVVDAQGNPAGGLTTRVFDRDRKYDDLLGETVTDGLGDFSVIYHERDFGETRENLPELYVMVSDASGKVVYSSRDSVRFESGRSEYFAIRIGAAVPGRKTAAPKATTSKNAVQRKKS